MGNRVRLLALSALGVIDLSLVGAAPALAGGTMGCHGRLTQSTGTTVEMVDNCFTPTTLRVQSGDKITFVNRDTESHNVTANAFAWGDFGEIPTGNGFTLTFDHAGIYPYGCTYHPGMTGAIVVGHGNGVGWPGSGVVGLLAGCAIGALGMGLSRVRRAATEA